MVTALLIGLVLGSVVGGLAVVLVRHLRRSDAGLAPPSETKEQLESRQRQLSSAIDTISEAVSVYDADDRFVFGNRRFLELNGLIADLLVPGMHIADLLRAVVERGGAPDAVGREEDWLAERLARHHHPDGPFEVRRQSGWMLVTQEKMADGGTVLLSADITSYKDAELQRRNALEEMHKANQAKARFLANISHELRTPLNAILGFSEILGREQFGPLGHEKYQEYAADIVTSSHHLLMLVNDLLDISTIEAGEKTLHREYVDTAGIIDECLHVVGSPAEEKHITLDTQIPDGQGVVYADRRAIKQIMLNLLSNAVKFTPEDGRISVTVANGKDNCVIAVRDTGIGIPGDRIPDLTDPFVRVEDNQYTAQEGTGLGLAIVDSLVKLHEGALNIDSEVGKGTTVTVSLPM
jgi:two-component system cell cycle sensor histidine kinase PleC